jgi:NADH-quinone oxidoreductase subunit E/NADP-reducing hydrogenase subunit HndA
MMVALSRIDESISRSGVIHAPREGALFSELRAAIDFYDRAPDALIQILHRAQELFGYLRDDVVRYIAIELRVPLSKVWGVIGFYSFFSRIPQGKFQINVCMGTACYVRGADQLVRTFENQLKIRMGETTPDGRFSLRCVRCLGACGLAPVAMVGKDVHSKLRTDQVKKVLKAYT